MFLVATIGSLPHYSTCLGFACTLKERAGSDVTSCMLHTLHTLHRQYTVVDLLTRLHWTEPSCPVARARNGLRLCVPWWWDFEVWHRDTPLTLGYVWDEGFSNVFGPAMLECLPVSDCRPSGPWPCFIQGLFSQFVLGGIEPTNITMNSLLTACVAWTAWLWTYLWNLEDQGKTWQ